MKAAVETVYSLQDLGNRFGVSKDTIRLRWIPYLMQVDGDLTVGRGKYNERCMELAESFSKRVGTSQEWVETFENSELKAENFNSEFFETTEIEVFQAEGDAHLAKVENFQLRRMSALQTRMQRIADLQAEVERQKSEAEEIEIFEAALQQVEAESTAKLEQLNREKKLMEAKRQILESIS